MSALAPTGARLGPYEIAAAIGAGGAGEVFSGRHELGREVAIEDMSITLRLAP